MTRSMDDRLSELQRRLLKDLEELGDRWMRDLQALPQRWFDAFQEEMGKWTQDLLKDAFNPARMMDLLRSLGLDPSRLAGMVGQQPGFDPYVILDLDKSASDEEVKQRYRELLFRYHPDRAGKQGSNFFIRMVVAAYNLIKRERGWQ